MLRLFFCLSALMVSSDSPAQGIAIESQGAENRMLYRWEDYEATYYQASSRYRLQDTSLYLENNVQTIELYEAANKLVFKVMFDRQGRVVHLTSLAKSSPLLVSTDVFPDQQKQLTVTRYYSDEALLRVDSTLLEYLTLYARNKPPFRYSKETYTSYKSGRYLTERNDYYKALATDGNLQDIHTLAVYSPYAGARRIDGNAALPFRWPKTDGDRLLLRRKVDPDRFYLTQQRKVYQADSGAGPAGQARMMKRSSVQYFKEGENYACCGILLPAFRHSNWCGYSQRYPTINSGPFRLLPYVQTLHRSNERGLTDSILQVTYTGQATDQPCTQPPDTAYTGYLNGYSGRPQEVKTLYVFRYSYFTE